MTFAVSVVRFIIPRSRHSDNQAQKMKNGNNRKNPDDVGIPAWNAARGMWRLAVQRNGKRKWFTSKTPGRSGRRIVEEKALAWLEELQQNSSLSVPTVSDAYAAWLDETKETVGMPSYRAQESLGRLYILPHIGTMRVDELTTEQPFQEIINHAFTHSAQGKKHLSHKTLENIRGAMTGFLRYCRKNGWSTLRLEFLDLPKKAKRPSKRILQPNELRILLSSDETVLPYHKSKSGPDELIHMYRFHVLTGLRPGELIGLRWTDISDGWVTMQRSINEYGEMTEGKNENALRAFLMPKRAAAEIAAQRELLDRMGVDSDYVFPDTRNGKPMNHKRYRRRFQIYCRHNGIQEITPYELRHTWYSVNKTLPVELVKQMGGHSEDMDTFGVYGHEMDGERAQFARMLEEKIDAILQDV